MDSKIWLSSPHMSGKEQAYINTAFETNWVTSIGPHIDGFENDIRTYFNNKSHVTVLSSGTAAIHLGLILLGIGQNDEVICQSHTFSATANPIVYLGATPIFVDSEKDSWNLSPELLEIAIKDRIKRGKKPKAIIAVHLYGMPYQVDQINRIASTYNIPILEDSAEALGSTYKNKKCGNFGEISVLSFNGNKIITTSAGGALITKSSALKEKAIFLATQAKDKATEYLHSRIGYNYRMSNVLAGIGRAQMEVLNDHVAARRKNYAHYLQQLKDIKELTFLKEPSGFYSNRWLTCVLTESEQSRDGLISHLNTFNIESRPLFKPLHQQPIFEDYPKYLNGVSAQLFKTGICLPSSSNLTDIELNRVTTAIKAYFRA